MLAIRKFYSGLNQLIIFLESIIWNPDYAQNEQFMAQAGIDLGHINLQQLA